LKDSRSENLFADSPKRDVAHKRYCNRYCTPKRLSTTKQSIKQAIGLRDFSISGVKNQSCTQRKDRWNRSFHLMPERGDGDNIVRQCIRYFSGNNRKCSAVPIVDRSKDENCFLSFKFAWIQDRRSGIISDGIPV